jgi:hypothetical protein
MKYYCPYCKILVERDSNSKTIYSYCTEADKKATMIREDIYRKQKSKNLLRG